MAAEADELLAAKVQTGQSRHLVLREREPIANLDQLAFLRLDRLLFQRARIDRAEPGQ